MTTSQVKNTAGPTPAYAVAILSTILAAFFGTLSISAALALFFGQSASYPSLISVLFSYSDPLVAPVAMAIAGVVFGGVALIGFSKVAKSPDTAAMVGTPAYNKITALGVIIPALLGTLSAIYALAVCFATLLAVQDGLNWAGYYLGQFLPALLLAVALIAVALLIKAFKSAKLQAKILAAIVLSLAGLGLILAFVAVGVKSHSDDASILKIERSSSSTVKSIYDYFNY
jgi:hypothetical protein